MHKTYWLIGASEGLGRAIAQKLDAEGCRLILSARSAERLGALAAELRDARALPMDVTDPESVAAAAAQIGAIDGVIYNAGAYEPMTAQDWDAAAALRVCDVNFMGAMRVLGAVTPGMAARGRGEIVVIGSIAGYRGLPGAIGYGASKAALMHLAENLQADLRGSGLRVQMINPGYIRTRLTNKNDFAMPMIMTPEDAAARTVAAMKSGRFRTDFPRPFCWLFRIFAMLPDWLYFRLIGGGRPRRD